MARKSLYISTKDANVVELTQQSAKPSYQYVCEYQRFGQELKVSFVNEFVIVRKYKIINDVSYDTDIYFIQKDAVDVIWPAVKLEGEFKFSTDASLYNDFQKSTFEELNDNEKYDVFTKVGDNEFQKLPIPCDKLKVYHPGNKNDLKAIIYADAIIESIHIHFLCSSLETAKNDTEYEFGIGNDRYAEFHEFAVPSLEWIFSGGHAYFKEDTGEISIKGDNDGYIIEKDNEVYEDFKLLTVPFVTKDNQEDGIVVKEYDCNNKEVITQNSINIPLRVVIYPYTEVDESTTLFVNDPILDMATCVFQNDASISISAMFGFDQGEPAIVSRFVWPLNSIRNLKEAYEYYYGVNLDDYENVPVTPIEEDEDNDEEVHTKQFTLEVIVFSDYRMTKQIYNSYVDLGEPAQNLDDFSFWLSNIFSDWRQFQRIVVIQTRMIDRYLGQIIKSNPVVLTQDKLRYLINEREKSRVNIDGTQQNIEEVKDMDLSKINFIDKVQCTIKREDNNQTPVIQNNTSPKVLFKPVFYRVQQLDNIELHTNLVQNVGIRLSDYMTKVDTFYIKIDNETYPELARNDVYVIFKVNTANITGTTGKYYILNQDNEFISHGNYTLI